MIMAVTGHKSEATLLRYIPNKNPFDVFGGRKPF